MRKIEIIPAFRHTLKLIGLNWRVAAKFALPWLALIATFNASLWITEKDETRISPLLIASFVVGYVAASSIATSWHRFILRDELPPHFRLDKPVWTFALRSLFIGLLCFLPLLLASQIFDKLPSLFVPVWAAISLYILVIFTRLNISTVATAIEMQPFTMQSAMSASKGNNWPILGLLLSNMLLVLAALTVYAAISAAVQTTVPALGRPATLLLSIPMQFLVMLLNAALQTTLYGYFVENRRFT
jgi:hypothetical protein